MYLAKEHATDFPVVQSILTTFFPVLEPYTLTGIQKSSNFPFHKLRRIRLSYLKFLIREEMRYIFLCLPPDRDSPVAKEDIAANFDHFYGLRQIKVQYKDAGQKSLSSPSREWKA